VPEVAADLTLLLERLGEMAPAARVVMIGCPDLSAAPGLPRLVRPLVGWRCRAIARVQSEVARRAGVALAPIPRRDLPPEVFGEDGFHPGVLGHERMAAAALALL
jgi:lysophospholipase L1-like esterase